MEVLFCGSCRHKPEGYTREKAMQLKARQRLSRELDVRHVVRNLRYVRNMFKYLVTLRERLMIRLQANHNVFDMKKFKKDLYEYDHDSQSSDFSSD